MSKSNVALISVATINQAIKHIKTKFNVNVHTMASGGKVALSATGDFDWLEVILELRDFVPQFETGLIVSNRSTFRIRKSDEIQFVE
jgi:hypothetical protein